MVDTVTVHLFRYMGPALLFAALIIVITPGDSVAQAVDPEEVFETAHVMELSLQFDPDRNKIACLGTPDTLHVSPKDVIVFRAVGTHVNDIRWDTSDNPGNGLAQGNKKNTGRFERGKSFAIRVNKKANKRHEGYKLKVKCGDLDDGPPVIIVDP
jgi:hypothetical protein